jgi:hypothetical protein
VSPATLDERIRAQVRESRLRQGLGPHITDSALLDRLAGRVLEREAELPRATEEGAAV